MNNGSGILWCEAAGRHFCSYRCEDVAAMKRQARLRQIETGEFIGSEAAHHDLVVPQH